MNVWLITRERLVTFRASYFETAAPPPALSLSSFRPFYAAPCPSPFL